MMTLACIRASKEEQTQLLDAQRAKIDALATMRDLRVSGYITDRESAKNLDRNVKVKVGAGGRACRRAAHLCAP